MGFESVGSFFVWNYRIGNVRFAWLHDRGLRMWPESWSMQYVWKRIGKLCYMSPATRREIPPTKTYTNRW